MKKATTRNQIRRWLLLHRVATRLFEFDEHDEGKKRRKLLSNRSNEKKVSDKQNYETVEEEKNVYQI